MPDGATAQATAPVLTIGWGIVIIVVAFIGGATAIGWRMLRNKVRLEALEAWRTSVRIVVTIMAAAFLFLGGPALMAILIFKETATNADSISRNFVEAKDLFISISPIATGIVTYWFASRAIEKIRKENQRTEEQQEIESEAEQEDAKNDQANSAVTTTSTPSHDS